MFLSKIPDVFTKLFHGVSQVLTPEMFIKIFPLILAFTREVETLFGPGKGKEKKEAVLELTLTFLPLAGVAVTEPVKQAVSDIIDGSVGVYNVVGMFDKKKSK